MYNLGLYFLKNESPDGAIKWFKAAAANGDTGSMFNLAKMARAGQGYPKPDDRAARDWYEQAGKKGHKSAMLNLALLYLTGSKTVPRDALAASRWMQKASDAG